MSQQNQRQPQQQPDRTQKTRQLGSRLQQERHAQLRDLAGQACAYISAADLPAVGMLGSVHQQLPR